MAKKDKDIEPSVDKLESDLKAVEEQALLYAKDLARIFIQRKEKERQLELTKQQLERSARISLLGELAAGIAHEMNNILTPAVGNLSILLLDRGDLPDELVKRLELIEESLMKASSMLQQVLDLSRKKPEKRESVNIGAILDQSLSLLKYKFLESGINVRQALEEGVPALRVDGDQIGQVFTNLSLNAIDAMDSGGDLRISTTFHSQGSGKSQAFVQVVFQDSGCGIPEEAVEHVFEPFFTTKESGRGTGLGLFICYGIVEKHGGTIDVESAPDKGTQFKICLPVN